MPDNLAGEGQPRIFQSTVGAHAGLRGEQPLRVTGYGVVVGLQGTGSADIPVQIRATLEREMGLRGVGHERLGMGNVTPNQLLNDANTAVVAVQGLIPPGAQAGSTIDVRIEAFPGSATTSLENGVLWTTDMHEGAQTPGSKQTSTYARASGPVYINPYAGKDDAIIRTAGRILGGCTVTVPRKLQLVLNNPSHARATTIVEAINQRFPRDTGREPTARGRDDEYIDLAIPQTYKDDPEGFIQLLRHTRLDTANPELWAAQYADNLKRQPGLADRLSWSLQAIGTPALPTLRELYTFSEIQPRLAALRAGAGLGDALTTPYLLSLARNDQSAVRLDAIRLLRKLGNDPKIDLALREILNDRAVDIRIAAYESLRDRGLRFIDRRDIGGKFFLDTVPSDTPMLYVAESGEPTVVVFGADTTIQRPCFASCWDNRLMLNADNAGAPLRLYYRDGATGQTNIEEDMPLNITEFIRHIAHTPTPEKPEHGLGFSYAQTIGAINELAQQDAIPAVFVPEQDRMGAEFLRRLRGTQAAGERPETLTEDPETDDQSQAAENTDQTPDESENQDAATAGFVVPLQRKSDNANK